ncbi:M56 family peptidase [Aquimarina sp. BL5]|uniref:M56 family metallopeptidase n=1 Tax=Aquimarina sp. BL5 TaxID=1714860 RepID=UPI000E4AA428|nr:M56 family metallopeptidase [Aquimarina sp. BL5]AXT51815.1 M56 family peptidase [Aquimarina sp. BL5]RKN11836.1 M56 family peptidase [Aquimarina sp. BL5]
MIHYILQIIAFQLLFLVIYDLFLKKETFFNWNRTYLLITPILSFLLPLIKLDFIRQNIPTAYIIQLPEVLITDFPMQVHLLPEVIIASESHLSSYISLIPVLGYLWYLGVITSSFLFIYKIFKIINLKRSGTKVHTKNITLISLPNTTIAFSFFNTIYIGTDLSEIKKTNILFHEKIHVKEYHSIDLIFFEILRILFWFNPLIYIYQNRIATLQEYIADAKAIAETTKKEYYQDLLSQVFQTEKISFINTFFNHSLIKNRLVMLQKSKSKKVYQLKYLLLIPVISSMLIYSSCSEDSRILEEKTTQNETAQKTLTQRAETLLVKINSEGKFTKENKELFSALMKDVGNSEAPDLEPEDLEVFQSLIQAISKSKQSTQPKKDGVPFVELDIVPIHPNCKGLSSEEIKKCFSQNIAQFVGSEFNIKIGENIGLSGKQRIYARFKVDKTGKVVDIQVRGPHPEFEKEALRVLKGLPNMEPGMKDGAPVSVLYSLPIVFDIKE